MSNINNNQNNQASSDFPALLQQPRVQDVIQHQQKQEQDSSTAVKHQEAGAGQTREQWLAPSTDSQKVTGASTASSSSGSASSDRSSGSGYTTKSLMHASFKGNAALVETILNNKSIDVNAIDDRGRSALSLAVAGGHLDVAKVLLEKGSADVNQKNKYGWTPLMIASGGVGNIEMVNLLLQYGEINVNAKKADGWTSLHIAVGTSNLDVVKVLLDKGHAHINTVNNQGSTPLHCVVTDGSTLQQRPGKFDDFVASRNQMFQLLLTKGANPFWKNKEGVNAMEEYFFIENHHANMPPKWSEFCVRDTLDWMNKQNDGTADLKVGLAKQPALPDDLLEEGKVTIPIIDKLADCFSPSLQNKEQQIQEQLQQQMMTEQRQFFTLSGIIISVLVLLFATLNVKRNYRNKKKAANRASINNKQHLYQQQQQQQQGLSLLMGGKSSRNYDNRDDTTESSSSSSSSSSDFCWLSPPPSASSPYATSSRIRRQIVQTTLMSSSSSPATPTIILLEEGYE